MTERLPVGTNRNFRARMRKAELSRKGIRQGGVDGLSTGSDNV